MRFSLAIKERNESVIKSTRTRDRLAEEDKAALPLLGSSSWDM